jgi:hypothetical protein
MSFAHLPLSWIPFGLLVSLRIFETAMDSGGCSVPRACSRRVRRCTRSGCRRFTGRRVVAVPG